MSYYWGLLLLCLCSVYGTGFAASNVNGCPTANSLVCNDQGTCLTTGVCQCNPDWFGVACQSRHCPGWKYLPSAILLDPKRPVRFTTAIPTGEVSVDFSVPLAVRQSDFIECSARGTCSVVTGVCECQNDANGAYFGPTCQYKHCPISTGSNSECNSVSGGGACNFSTGTCTCSAGYFGTACDQKHCPGAVLSAQSFSAAGGIPRIINDLTDYIECNGRGTCSYSTGTCVCKANFLQPDCMNANCPVNINTQQVCSGTGSCDNTLGLCSCNAGFYGKSCEKKHCPNVKTNAKPEDRDWIDGDFIECSGNGNCDLTEGICTCAERFYLSDCSLRSCLVFDGRQCNGQGTCVTSSGTCVCTNPYFGNSCQNKHCPGYNGKVECNGRGTCDEMTGTCACNSDINGVYFGPSCALKKCPTNDVNLVCSGNGSCDTTVGSCVCNDDFYSSDCSKKHCPGFVTRFDPQTPPKRPLVSSDFMECLDRGICDTVSGLCTCATQYAGPDCSMVNCPIRNGVVCGGDGSCNYNTGACSCNNGFFSDNCASRKCPVVGEKECAGRGTCDPATGMCTCASGFGGVACSVGSGQVKAITCDGTAATGC